ncbi:hypothetical protein [Streptomyces sp. SPB4]|uniref:hypothetical protein n=1 Tax=Streptomyces sp. SPB4 TaxID=2940553 RepID=UPI00247472A8|nr:hypothetical protein [Streptomyces sp. SPB4]MDH6545890.1 hypothetical protein [Streptomyces sp. SPB4]
MSDDEGRVLPFRPTGGAAPPPPPPPPLLPPPPALPPPPVPVEAEDGMVPALADGEELSHPVLVVPGPAVPPPPVPALPVGRVPRVPAALRSENSSGGQDGVRAGLGSAMVVAIGIAVAALRGMSQWLSDRRQRFEERAPVRQAAATAKAERIKARAEHAAALAKIGDDAQQARAKSRVQSPTDFGRSAKSGGKAGSGGGTFGPKTKHRPAKASGATPDAQKAAAARRKAQQDAAQPEKKKQGPLERMRRKDSDGGKQSAPGQTKRPSSGGTGKPGVAKDGKSPTKGGSTRPDGSGGSGKGPGEKAGRRPWSKSAPPGRGKTDKPSKPKTGSRKGADDKGQRPPEPPAGGPVPPGKELPAPRKAPGGKGRGGKSKGPKRPSAPWGWRKWKRKPPPAARPQGGSGPAASGGPASTSGPQATGPGSRSRRNRERQAPPRQAPASDGEWLRPPPGMDTTYSVTIERPERDQAAKPPAQVPGALTSRPPLVALPAGTPPPPPQPDVPQPPPPPQPVAPQPPAPPPATTTAGPTGSVPPPRKEARPMGGAPAVRDTQFADSDLTVYDVIDSDEDMAQQILLGAVHARHVADRCQRLQSALEEMRAELIAKSVPGVFVGWCTRLIERAGVVETKADAVADGLPRASEAIAHAGQLASEHDKPVADKVRDMGHTAPADASYHKE